jgi:hypothetical protein
MPDMISALNTTIEDQLPRVYRDAGPLFFPIAELADRVTDNVAMSPGSPNDLSRLYQVKHGWKTGGAGMIRSISPYGSPTLDVGTEARLLDSLGSDSDMSPWPRASDSPLPGDFVRTLYLSACAGNFPFPMHWAFADSLQAQTLQQLSRIITESARKTKRMDAQSYFAYRATNASGYKTTVLSRAAHYAVGTTNTPFTKTTHSTRAASTNANFVDITIDPRYGTIANFMEGDEIDVVANSGGSETAAGTLQDGTALNGTDVRNCASGTTRVQLTVVKVDRLRNVITVIGLSRNSELATPTADAITAYGDTHGWTVDQSAPPVAYDWIVPAGASRYSAGTRPWLTWGIFDWTAATGTIMGGSQYAQGLDLDEYPMFKSILHTASGPLTEGMLDRMSIEASLSFPNVKITDWMTTGAALLRFKEEIQNNTQSKFERTNLPFEVKGGWSCANYTTPQGEYRWWTSPFMHKGKMIGQQIDKTNLKIYTNKMIGDAQEGFAEDVQFVGRLLGYPTSKVPETAANGTPKTVSGMPWIRFVLMCPIMPNGWLIDSITEADTKNFTV